MSEIVIDPELQALIPPLSKDEYATLEQNIIRDGCRDPLVTWLGTIVDGYNRHRICTEHGLPYSTKPMDFADKAAARIWMRSNQMGRRNLTPAWLIELELGNKEDLRLLGRANMQAGGGDKVSPEAKAGLSTNDKPAQQHNTQKQIAQAAGVSTGQVGMAEQVRKKSPALWEKAKQGEVSVSAAYKAVKKKEQAHNHRAQGTGENEWYTPDEYLDAARDVLTGFDLDPASSETAQKKICATKYYTKEQNGLEMPWFGRVWLNPPYSQPLIFQFIDRLCSAVESDEIDSAIMLTHNYTDTKWFHRAASVADAICFTRGRIKFYSPSGEVAAPTQGQAFFYFGKGRDGFAAKFSAFGFVVVAP